MQVFSVKPLYSRVIIKRAEVTETKSAGGVMLPETLSEKPNTGRVMAIGPGTDEDPTTVPEGVDVVFSKYAGKPITIEGVDYLVMSEDDIIAII